MKRVYLEYKSHFDAAHFLREYDGPCSHLHGHRWEVAILISGTELNKFGILIDFKVLKRLMTRILPDHQCLNEVGYFRTINPTAENLAQWLFERLLGEVGNLSDVREIRLERVTVWESPDASASVAREVYE